VQVDVAAINWQTHDLLLGECKWGADRVSTVKPCANSSRPKHRWCLSNCLVRALAGGSTTRFSRAHFTVAARQEAEARQALLVDVKRFDADLLES
jgi:hypothetical protein